jgi:hypothetical protein
MLGRLFEEGNLRKIGLGDSADTFHVVSARGKGVEFTVGERLGRHTQDRGIFF